ncbi:MAG: hypothetical protein K6B42_03650 [Clostridia bacterium]|nr:hypothetical protein [Clostridia bacterium]
MDSIFMTMEEWGETVDLHYGIFCIIPILVILVIALWKKVTLPSLLAGVIVACFMVAKFNPLVTLGLFMDQLYTTACDADTMWVLLVCGLFGSLIALMTESGGVLGFTTWTRKILNSRKKTLIGTWILGIIVFVDDYLNCLAVGAAVRPLADDYKISREMLSYIINSTGVTICAIIPISSWGAFMSGLMEKSELTGGLSAFSAYCHAIPFMFYALVAVITVPLVSLGILPMFRNMRKAEDRAINTGEVLSAESKAALIENLDDEERLKDKPCRLINFVLPILVVVAMTIWLDDMVYALVIAILVCLVMYLPQRLMNLLEFVNTFMKGLTDMFGVLVMIIICYMLIDLNAMLGLNDFVTAICSAAVPVKILPMLIFIGLGLLSFGSATFWGLAAVAFPIVGSLSASMGINPFILSGAVVSAVAFGGHICMYSDTVILTSASTQATCSDYFRASFPIVMVFPFAIGALLFLIAGCIML